MLEKTESMTAKVCAFTRAYHSYFTRDKIYDDYLAYDLLGREEYDSIKDLIASLFKSTEPNEKRSWNEAIEELVSPIILPRIRYAETKLKEFATENEFCQYVICGAGVDSFSFRNENPNIEVFELDHPDTQRYKLDRIQKMEWTIPKNVHFVPIDFKQQSMADVLMAHGFNPAVKTFFSILGVSYYLSLDTLETVFSSLSRISAGGSCLVFDYPDLKGHQDKHFKKLKHITATLGETMQEGFSYESLEDKLLINGYSVLDYKSPEHIQKIYFDSREDQLCASNHVHFILANYKGGEN
ncbi:class I SAM-dependent methyltransferase [Aminipila butyrica]|uniref:S-adenosyl-L-methionine-dependent methyltransferase n=1 Tax=Aminipila butyrica TaxID=433296 RepID=A0A858BT76_9FIRM|nr:class I SAM-dependent methyltransferase [Aminipila butyrica]QIB67974.1 class I SAM-dependent methyltransferase [Aminipila butyrica]